MRFLEVLSSMSMKILVNVNHPKCLIVIVFFYSFIFLASWYFPFWRCVFSLITSILIWNGWVRQFAKLYGEEGMLTFLLFSFTKMRRSSFFSFFFFWNHKLLKLLNISQAKNANLRSGFVQLVTQWNMKTIFIYF